jgi:hypothetical protein
MEIVEFYLIKYLRWIEQNQFYPLTMAFINEQSKDKKKHKSAEVPLHNFGYLVDYFLACLL